MIQMNNWSQENQRKSQTKERKWEPKSINPFCKGNNGKINDYFYRERASFLSTLKMTVIIIAQNAASSFYISVNIHISVCKKYSRTQQTYHFKMSGLFQKIFLKKCINRLEILFEICKMINFTVYKRCMSSVSVVIK